MWVSFVIVEILDCDVLYLDLMFVLDIVCELVVLGVFWKGELLVMVMFFEGGFDIVVLGGKFLDGLFEVQLG